MHKFYSDRVVFYTRSMVALCLTMLLSCSCAQGDSLAGVAPDAAPVELNASGRPAQWKYFNEQEWIVATVGLDIVEMLAYAKSLQDAAKKISPVDTGLHTETVALKNNLYRYRLSPAGGKSINYSFTLKDYIWSPDNYVPLASQLIAQFNLAPDSVSEPPSGFLKKLANADMPGLFEEDKRISEALSRRPLDAVLHEQAALLIDAFGLQEMAGRFSDGRQNLNRAAAHLALARALNHKASELGQVADIAQESMACRLSVAVNKITAMEKKAKVDSAVAAWLNAYRMFSSGDYRIFNAKDHTAIEERQFSLHSSLSNNDDSIMRYAEKYHPSLPVEWMRLIGNTTRSVESGHLVRTHVVAAEVKAYLDDFNSYKNAQESDCKNIVGDLNLGLARCLSLAPAAHLRVLPWENIAAFHCRHILNGVNMEYNFFKSGYADAQAAAQTASQARNYFSKLNQFPFVETCFLLHPEEKAEFFRGSQALVVSRPEIVASENWDTVNDCVKAAKDPKPALVAESLWFDPAFPMGTAFYFHSRKFLTNYKRDLAELTRLKALCPYSESLITEWVEAKYGAKATAEQYLEAFANLVDYMPNTRATAAAAALAEPDKYIALQTQTAKLQPFRYYELASYCVLHHRQEQAAQFFEKAVALETNDVRTSNQADWLVNYRFDHGQKAKAEELAKFAGEVYSRLGLQSLARWDERVDDLKGAEENYRNIAERYPESGDAELTAFYIRNADKNGEYKAEAEKRIREVFPAGLKKVALVDFKAPPTQGILITSADKLCPESPIVKDVVIVAVNGYLVEKINQFHVARNIANTPVLSAIIWNGKSYIETKKPVVNNNYFSVGILAYQR